MDKYMTLVEHFPLTLIESDEHHSRALYVIAEVSQRENELVKEEIDYVKALLALIDIYEQSLSKLTGGVAPPEALEFLMEENKLKAVDISRELQIPESHISAFLSGTRRLTKTEVGKLSERFCVSPLLFIDSGYFKGESLRAVAGLH